MTTCQIKSFITNRIKKLESDLLSTSKKNEKGMEDGKGTFNIRYRVQYANKYCIYVNLCKYTTQSFTKLLGY